MNGSFDNMNALKIFSNDYSDKYEQKSWLTVVDSCAQRTKDLGRIKACKV